jgi:hypothetical protein
MVFCSYLVETRLKSRQATSESLAASLVADAWKNVLLLGEGQDLGD